MRPIRNSRESQTHRHFSHTVTVLKDGPWAGGDFKEDFSILLRWPGLALKQGILELLQLAWTNEFVKMQVIRALKASFHLWRMTLSLFTKYSSGFGPRKTSTFLMFPCWLGSGPNDVNTNLLNRNDELVGIHIIRTAPKLKPVIFDDWWRSAFIIIDIISRKTAHGYPYFNSASYAPILHWRISYLKLACRLIQHPLEVLIPSRVEVRLAVEVAVKRRFHLLRPSSRLPPAFIP